MTVVWGAVQVGVALVAIKLSSRIVDEVLGIASFTNGVMLGIFLLGTLTRRVQQRATCVGIVAGALTMLVVRLYTSVSWQWYVLIGSGATFGIAWLASLLIVEPQHAEPDRLDSETSW
jgi:Na+/proline symporter